MATNTETSKTTKTTNRSLAPRVPCPLGPSHTVPANRVEQHVRKCPFLRKQQQLEQETYYCRDINNGGHGDVDFPVTNKAQHDDLAWAQRVASAVLEIHQHLFVSKEGLTNAKELTLQEIENALVLQDLSDYELQSGLEKAIDSNRVKSGGPKHLHQQASLVGHLRRLGALPARDSDRKEETLRDPKKARTTPHAIFEMGAGRGMLGLVAAGVSARTQPTNLVLIERGGSRSKADKVLRNLPKDAPDAATTYLNLYNVQFSRIQCDLAHVKMKRVLEEQKASEIHVIAKHLCGAGTDLALKALEPVRHQVSTCLFATCCHGVCVWQDYVGRDYLRNLFSHKKIPFGRDEFELLRRWSSGTVLTNSEDADGHPVVKCNSEEDDVRSPVAIGRVVESLGIACGVQGLGRCSQRLIDYGRRQYMEEVLFCEDNDAQTSLLHYVAPGVTPQNAVLLGQK